MSQEYIEIKGARVNNLKNVDVRLPRDKFIVIAGVSGSGKSSLAFDTLYAEGQRRYVESLSSYARQFLGRMNKPECDFIRGIPPAIAIEQKVIARNPRSTVGTSTEIYEYLRLLFARIGHTYSPISGQEVKKHTTEDVVRCMQQFSEGTKFLVLAPLIVPDGRTVEQQLKASLLQGYSRILAPSPAPPRGGADTSSTDRSNSSATDGVNIVRIEDYLESLPSKSDTIYSSPSADNGRGTKASIYLVIDRLTAPKSIESPTDVEKQTLTGADVTAPPPGGAGRGAKEVIDRLVDSCETAFYEGHGELRLMVLPSGLSYDFSTRFEADGMAFEEPTDQLFSFNSPAGACPECQGFGKIIGIDEHLVIPNTSLSVYDGCVQPWHGEKLGEWKDWFIQHAANDDFPIFEPYYNLTQQQKDWLWHGLPSDRRVKEKPCIDAFFDMVRESQYKIQYRVMLARYRGKTICPRCHGTRLKPEANYVKIAGRSITDLVEMPVTRLKEWFDQLTSHTSVQGDLQSPLTPQEQEIGRRLLTEITSRLQFLLDVGLGYLTLNRLSNTLSGGESQRINLCTSLGSSLVGSLYILDEPSIGLHSRDTGRLIKVLRQLQALGNTVVVVEHDEEIMRAADWLIDVGPDAGRLGGEIVYEGSPKSLTSPTPVSSRGGEGSIYKPRRETKAEKTVAEETKAEKSAIAVTTPLPPAGGAGGGASYTLQYLSGQLTLPVPASRRPWNRHIDIRQARMNNLRGIDVQIPLNVMTVVTGVSGSGKSSLIKGILYPALKRHLGEVFDAPGAYGGLGGDVDAIQHVEFVDQNPIGKSTRSNPATYVKAYDAIRELFAEQPLAQQMGFTPQYFSFNTDGGRCDECKGAGTITVEMQFMADLVLECESCHGHRFKQEILDVMYKGKNIDDVLDMTIEEAMEFFSPTPNPSRRGEGSICKPRGETKAEKTAAEETKAEKSANVVTTPLPPAGGAGGGATIVKRLRPLYDVGLGYIKLGQNSSSLSGGENQRVKLAYYIGQEKQEPTLFIFDEPTTGLHFHDIARLLKSMDALIERGHTILIIEHNLDVIKMADHVIDLGPEGGDSGGNLVIAGTPEEVARCKESITGKYLAQKLTNN